MTSLAVLKLVAVALQILYREAKQRNEARDILVWNACVAPGGAA